MTISCDCNNRNLIIKITGEVDHHTSEMVKDKIDKEFSRNHVKNIIFDFSSIDFMDSSGIGVIIGRYKNVTNVGGKVAIVGANPSLDRIFNISGLYKIIKSYSSLEKALDNLA